MQNTLHTSVNTIIINFSKIKIKLPYDYYRLSKEKLTVNFHTFRGPTKFQQIK